MNPGFLSYILLILSYIFIGFGWKKQAIGEAAAARAAAFGLLWIVCAACDWSAFGASGTFAYLPCALLAVCGWRAFPPGEAPAAFAFGILTGAVHALITHLKTLHPLLFALHPAYDPLLAVCLLAIAYTRQPKAQFALISIALVTSDIFRVWSAAGHLIAAFGGREFQDAWWLAVFAARAASVIGTAAAAQVKRGAEFLRKELRARR